MILTLSKLSVSQQQPEAMLQSILSMLCSAPIVVLGRRLHDRAVAQRRPSGVWCLSGVLLKKSESIQFMRLKIPIA